MSHGYSTHAVRFLTWIGVQLDARVRSKTKHLVYEGLFSVGIMEYGLESIGSCHFIVLVQGLLMVSCQSLFRLNG